MSVVIELAEPNGHMEHRWGTRVDMDVPAEILTDEEVSCPGSVRNASISGAFIETRLLLPLLSCISLDLDSGNVERLDACVVRVEDSGIAVEWLDPGPWVMSALLSLQRDSRGEVLQTMPERVISVQASGGI